MSIASPSPSPSPTPPPAQPSSPHHHSHHQSISTKPGAVVATAKSTLAEQSARLTLKHNTDLDLLDDLRLYLKSRCSIERDYAQSLAKLNGNHSKRSSPLLSFVATEDENADIKTLYTSWKIYQEEMEKHAKSRLAQFEQLTSVCDSLKSMRSHKIHVAKKCLDSHLKKMQEEIINSVNEIDKTRKLYFEEEHLAKQARDKEEKIKKRKTGIFSSFTNLQNKKERTSAHREASDIQSTQARNDYIMALAAGNAHLHHYYSQDLCNLMLTIDDGILDKCRAYILNMLQAEHDICDSWSEVIAKSTDLFEHTSADHISNLFLRDPNSASLNETLLYEFQPCDNDPIDTISLEHNADIALRNEGQKWFTWFSKECRNLNRLSAQLIRVQALMSEGHKTVEVTGSGQVDIETRIDDIRQQLRKCEISKLKAKARLQVIKDSGAEVEDFEGFEAQVAMEIKQQSLEVDNINLTSLSRTSSMRSNVVSMSESKTLSRADTENATVISSHVRPESSSSAEQLDSPDREVLQMGSSMECASPAPTTTTHAATIAATTTATPASWDLNYDPTQAWNDDPEPTATSSYNGYDDVQAVGVDNKATIAEDHYGTAQDSYYDQYSTTADGFSLVGKQCFALYTYEAQNEDDLSMVEQEVVTVLDASDKDWVRAQNQNGQYGYVPAAYLQELASDVYASADTSNTSPYPDQNAVSAEPYPESYSEPNASVEVDPYSSALPPPPPLPEASVIDNEATNTAECPVPAPPPPPPLSSVSGDSAADVVYVRAIYDYVATSHEEISFNAGDLIQIVDNSSDDGWWTGKMPDGSVGHFPSMLVCDDDDEDEEEEEEEDEDDDDDEAEVGADAKSNGEEYKFNGYQEPDGTVLSTPSLPPLPSSAPAPPPPMPLPPPPPPITTAENDENGLNQSLPPPPLPPPPKPMHLMAPQTVVIIQPTPEIESRPVLGSEVYAEMETQNDYAVDEEQGQANSGENSGGNGTAQEEQETTSSTEGDQQQQHQPQQHSESSVRVSVAIAAHEISEAITQQAMDESMRELSRRTSAASSYDEWTTDGAPVPSTSSSITMNGDISHHHHHHHHHQPHQQQSQDLASDHQFEEDFK